MLCYWIKKDVGFVFCEDCFLFIGGGGLKRVGGSCFLGVGVLKVEVGVL